MTLTKIFSFVFLLSIAISSSAAGKPEVHDAWARETPPTANVMAAYLTLYNPSSRVYTLTGLSSPDFKRAEMHRTEQLDGMTRMIPVPQIRLSSKGRVIFQPGNMHLMLTGPKKRLRAGDNITLTLFFTDERSTKNSMEIALPVKKAMANTNRSTHNKQHDSHQH